jgi:hypothetical protein
MGRSRLDRVPDGLIDGVGGDRPGMAAESAGPMDLGLTLHSEVMEWTTTSVRPGGRVDLSEGLE